MRIRRISAATAAVLLAGALTAPAAASGISPAQLARAGWDCILPPPDFNPNVHCAAPGTLAGVLSGEAKVVMVLAFATDDLDATDAELLGSERMFRSDVYDGQPCPTDPPSLEYSWLFPRFGWDYYICHTFDSPW